MSLIDSGGFPKPTAEQVASGYNWSSCGVAFTLVEFIVESMEALVCRGFFKALRKSSIPVELYGPTRHRVIDIVERPSESISDNKR